jgi:hypothetical protein
MTAFKTITLVHPVTLGAESQESISVVELRRPTGLDYRQVQGATNNYDLCLKFAAQLSGLPDVAFDRMDGVDDVPRIVEAVTGFLTNSPKTGQTSSGT